MNHHQSARLHPPFIVLLGLLALISCTQNVANMEGNDMQPKYSDPSKKPYHGRVPVSGGELYFERTGKGEAIILIHAGFSDRRDWQHQLEDFSKDFSTIVYDQRGAGNSPVPATGFSPADDLKALIEHLELKKAVLVGHSIGGTIALDFALQYPEKVSALVLLAPGLNGYSWSKEYLEWMQGIWSIPQSEAMTKNFLSAPFYAIAIGTPNIESEIRTMTRESFEKALTWKSVDVHWHFPEQTSKLKTLKIPTLLISGDRDSRDIEQIAETISTNLPNTKVVKIKNTDHLLNFERPKELNAAVIDFLSNLNSRTNIEQVQ